MLVNNFKFYNKSIIILIVLIILITKVYNNSCYDTFVWH